MNYEENILPNPDDLLDWCSDPRNVDWGRENYSIFGKRGMAPRQVAWFGKTGTNYRYSGLDHEGDNWPRFISELADEINDKFDLQTNFVLLNRYSSGEEYMGWHRDNESGLKSIIASVSLGATRRFRYRGNSRGSSHAIDLTHGSVLVFDGRFYHTLPKSKRCIRPRINLTFRELCTDLHSRRFIQSHLTHCRIYE